MLALSLALAGVLLVATAAGSVALPFRGVLAALLARAGLPGVDSSALGPTGEAILFSVRLPRVLLAALGDAVGDLRHR